MSVMEALLVVMLFVGPDDGTDTVTKTQTNKHFYRTHEECVAQQEERATEDENSLMLEDDQKLKETRFLCTKNTTKGKMLHVRR